MIRSDAVYRFRFMRLSMLGWSCPQCYWIYPHPAAAMLHEERIEENSGICPERRSLRQQGKTMGDEGQDHEQ
jgi:hypothetical protein